MTKLTRLQEDCNLLGYKYKTISKLQLMDIAAEAQFNRVEDLAQRMYESEGYLVDRSEGAIYFLLHRMLTAMSHPGKATLEAIQMRLDPARFQQDLTDPVVFEVLCTQLLASNEIQQMHERWCKDPAHAIWPRQAGSLLKWKFVKTYIEEYSENLKLILHLRIKLYGGMGWPDLTLLRDGKVHFVEVKLGTDRFTERQRDWAGSISHEMKLFPTLLHVTP